MYFYVGHEETDIDGENGGKFGQRRKMRYEKRGKRDSADFADFDPISFHLEHATEATFYVHMRTYETKRQNGDRFTRYPFCNFA